MFVYTFFGSFLSFNQNLTAIEKNQLSSCQKIYI